VNGLLAATIVAEIGIDMAAFGTAQRLAAWATLLQGLAWWRLRVGQQQASALISTALR